MTETIITYSQFAGGMILLLFCILQFSYKHKSFLNFNLAGLYFCLSIVLLHLWLFRSGNAAQCPMLLHVDTTVGFIIGPMVFFYISAVTGLPNPSRKRYLPHFLPAVAALFLLLGSNATSSTVADYYRLHPGNTPNYRVTTLIAILDTLSNLSMIIYFSLGIRQIYLLLRDRNHKAFHELRILFAYMLCVAFAVVMMIVAGITENMVLDLLSVYALMLLALWYFLFSFRYPEFTQRAIKEARQARSAPLVGEAEAEVIIGRMNSLMAKEKLFTDPDLTLKKVSSLLGITPHVLSQIINDRLEMNFRSYLNGYRVREAQHLLEHSRTMNILEIALSIGFNSKSSFNGLFSAATGVTPREYRDRLKIKK